MVCCMLVDTSFPAQCRTTSAVHHDIPPPTTAPSPLQTRWEARAQVPLRRSLRASFEGMFFIVLHVSTL